MLCVPHEMKAVHTKVRKDVAQLAELKGETRKIKVWQQSEIKQNQQPAHKENESTIEKTQTEEQATEPQGRT